MWSTAPSTPVSQHRSDESGKNPADTTKERRTSYEIAMESSRGKGVWHHGGEEPPGERHGQIPKHITSDLALNGAAGSGGSGNVTRGQDRGFPHIPNVGGAQKKVSPEIISPSSHSPSKIHRGFMPSPCDGFDATNSADLPGSRGAKVITTPPHPQGSSSSGKTSGVGGSEPRPRAQSIEEADRRRGNYVPHRSPNDPPLRGG